MFSVAALCLYDCCRMVVVILQGTLLFTFRSLFSVNCSHSSREVRGRQTLRGGVSCGFAIITHESLWKDIVVPTEPSVSSPVGTVK